MKRVLVITRRYNPIIAGYRWNPYLFPLWHFSPALRQRGVAISYGHPSSIIKKTWDAILIDDKAFTQHYRVSGDVLSWLNTIKNKAGCVVWLDNSDSGGTTHFEVLPYVDYYAKRQIYTQRDLYRKTLYGGRLYTDFYHSHNGVTDQDPMPEPAELPIEMDRKLIVSWNFAFADYRWQTRYQRYLYGFTRKNTIKYCPPETKRNIPLFGRFSTQYTLDTVRYQRQSLQRELHASGILASTDRISRQQFSSEMRNSVAALSPFGWGELCLRDFESWISGCALIKPDVSHLETWPHLFRPNQTYFPLPWDICEMVSAIQKLLADPDALLQIAKQGQDAYKDVWSSESEEAFCQRFKVMTNLQ